MSITLREAMTIEPFSSAKLIGGAAGLNRMVESANIQEVPEVGRWLHGGEILFSSGYAFRSTQDAVQLMEMLSQMKVCALAIKPGQYLPEIPQELINCADRLSFPLFELPPDLPYMDCIIPIFERITQKQLAIMRRVENIHNRLMESILHKDGLQGIAQVLASEMQHAVYIYSPLGSVLAQSSTEEQESDPDIIKKVSEYLSLRVSRNMRPNQCNAINIGRDIRLTCVPVFVQDGLMAFLLMNKAYDQTAEMDLIAFENASSLIAIELLNEIALVQKEQRIREQLLEDILTKRYSDNRLIFQRGQYAGFDLEKPYCVLEISPLGFEEYIYEKLKYTDETDIQNLKANVHSAIYQGLSFYPAPVLTTTSGVHVVAMACVKDQKSSEELHSTLCDLLRQLKQTFPHLGFIVGIGRTKEGVENAVESRQEAEIALRAGRKLRSQGDGVYYFEQIGCLSFLSELQDSRVMQNFYEENLRELLDYDAQNQSELIPTLETFFACGKNLRKTSEELYIHKNSVIYRLHKIEELTGQSLSDPTTCFNFQLCLQLRSILS